MPTIRLTQAAVERLKPPATGRVEYWDSQLPGFGLRIAAPRPGRPEKDARRTWQALYRIKGLGQGAIVRETIGTTAIIPDVADARARARASIDLAKQGINPIEKREAERSAAERAKAERERDTVGAVIDRYLADGGYAQRRMRPDYFAETKRTLDRDVKAAFGLKPVRDLARRDIRELVDGIVAGRDRKKSAPSHANHTLAYLRAMLNWAVANDLIDANPADGIKMPAPLVQRDRALDDEEIRLFWLGCDQIGEPFGPLFKLLLLTAQRRDELAQATWSEFNLDKALWTIPGERTKNGKAHIVHLSQSAVEILAKLPKIGKKGFLFTTTGETPVSGFGRARERLDDKIASIRKKELLTAAKTINDAAARAIAIEEAEKIAVAPFTLHDLRRSAATGMAGIGIAHHALDKVLNHVGGKISGVGAIYNRFEYLDERKAALDAWARHVEGLIDPTPANVVPIRRAAE
jgi:integrase